MRLRSLFPHQAKETSDTNEGKIHTLPEAQIKKIAGNQWKRRKKKKNFWTSSYTPLLR
jgi:hypothetical protein